MSERAAIPRRRSGQCGQASVELLAVVPAVLLVGALVWQLALVGHTAWLCAHAARAAARAEAVGADRDRAAASALPASMRSGLLVSRAPRPHGAVRVEVAVPLLVRSLHAPVRIGASAGLGQGR